MYALTPHRLVDVLDGLFSHILEIDVERSPDVFMNIARHADTAGFRETLHTRKYVYAVAIEIAALDDGIAEADADAE